MDVQALYVGVMVLDGALGTVKQLVCSSIVVE